MTMFSKIKSKSNNYLVDIRILKLIVNKDCGIIATVCNLKLLTHNNRRQKAAQVVGIPFFFSESKPFVMVWISQQRGSTAVHASNGTKTYCKPKIRLALLNN